MVIQRLGLDAEVREFPVVHGSFASACANTTTLDAVIAESLGPQSQTYPQTYVYECSDGTRFTVRIEGEKTWLFLPNQTLSLPHVPSGSGAKYREGVSLLYAALRRELLK